MHKSSLKLVARKSVNVLNFLCSIWQYVTCVAALYAWLHYAVTTKPV